MANILFRKGAASLFLFLLTLNCFAQLPNFTITATATPETCPANGALSYSVAGTAAGATITYAIYLLPNLTVPLTATSATTVGSLEAGNYRVVATQSMAGETPNTSFVNVTIPDQTNPLVFNLTQVKACGPNSGTITVNVTSGTAVTYRIVSGPVTRPAQASNVFNNLPIGQYNVEVTDSCGVIQVVTFQVTALSASVGVSQPTFGEVELPSCSSIIVTHEFVSTGADGVIAFPLTFTYTVFPPGGGTPVVVNQVVASGSNILVNLINSTLPFYHNQQYSYNLQVTDACGTVYPFNNNTINKKFDFLLVPDNPECIEFKLSVVPQFFVAPYTVSFISAPPGFVPANFNAAHPSFNSGVAIYGTAANPIPMGTYSVQVTDACGRTATHDIQISNDSDPVVSTSTNAATCLGQVSIILSGRGTDSVVITSGPPTYTPQPNDVSAGITPQGFMLGDLPFGQYVFTVTDACGVVYPLPVNLVPTGGDFLLDVTQRPGCATNEGSLRLRIPGGIIAGVTITAGNFGEPLPYIADALIDGTGMFYMNSLPEGNYTFKITNICGIEKIQPVTIEGYHVQASTIDIIPNCSSFDLELHHTSNGNYVESYWLQKFNPVSGNWGHPLTGVAYTPGTLPTAANSKFLLNNTINVSLAYTGQFRVVKAFYTFSNGSAANALCISVLDEFTFDNQVSVTGAYGFPCVDNTTEVIIEAEGVAPLNYAIVDENDNVLVNNGTSNVFSGLTAGTYIIRVTDMCGSSIPYPVNVNEIEPIEIVGTNLCEGENGQLSVPQLPFLTYEWYKGNDTANILSTTDVLSLSPFDSATHSGEYHVRITSTIQNSCANVVLDYTVEPNVLANAGEDDAVVYCNAGEVIDLGTYLSTPHDAGGVWADVDASGALNANQLTTAGLAQGTYRFTYTVNGDCGSTDMATITIEVKDIPLAPVVAPVSAVCEGESVQLNVTPVANISYQWTGPNNFSSTLPNPLIEQASVMASGTYQVAAITPDGCASPFTQVVVTVNALPDFTITGNTSLCSGQSTSLAVDGINFDEEAIGVTYKWYYNNELMEGEEESEISISTTGNYRVEVDNNGCVSNTAVDVIENTNAFVVELTEGCIDFDYTVSVTNTADLLNATYSWTGPGGFTATGPEIVITNRLTGDYTVVVTNAEGCSAEAVQSVTNTHCMIPKGISPGDADYNNNFDLSNMDVEQLRIYNRYGLEVYHKANYTNEWYGQSAKGNELPTGTYYYDLMLGSGKRLTGWVYINRAN